MISMMVGCGSPDHDEQKAFKTMMLRVSGEVETLPNEASFRVSLNCLKPSIKASKNCLVDKSAKLTEKLLSFGIDEKDLLTTAVNLRKSYDWVRNSNVFKGYNSSTEIYVTVKDLDKLGNIYAELLENSDLSIGSLSYTHTSLDSLENEAYVTALRNSRILAEKLLAELQGSDLEILKIGNVEISSSLPDESYYKEEKMYENYEFVEKNKGVSINTGTVRVVASLYVEYLVE